MEQTETKEQWVLRCGDLLPEKADTMQFTSKYCNILREKGLLFDTKEQAMQASFRATAAVKENDFRLNIGELAKRFMNCCIGFDRNGHQCVIIEISEDEAKEYAPDDYENGYFGHENENGSIDYGYYLCIDLETRGVGCIDKCEYDAIRERTIQTDSQRSEELRKLRKHLIDIAPRPSYSVPHRDIVREAKRMYDFIETGNIKDSDSSW